VVALADEGAGGGQLLARLDQVGQGAHFPGQVVQADMGPRRRGARAVDLEQAEVMIVGGPGRTQKGGAAGDLSADLEAERLAVEADRAGQVADVEHGVVQAADSHDVFLQQFPAVAAAA